MFVRFKSKRYVLKFVLAREIPDINITVSAKKLAQVKKLVWFFYQVGRTSSSNNENEFFLLNTKSIFQSISPLPLPP
jgi:hypothetical protein